MTTVTGSLWPTDISVYKLRAPITLMREQAGFLCEQTGGLVDGEVTTKVLIPSVFVRLAQEEGAEVVKCEFEHSFYVVAPALDRYQFLLFSILHPNTFYPLFVSTGIKEFPEKMKVESEEEFVKTLVALFSSAETKRIIHALLAQSQV